MKNRDHNGLNRNRLIGNRGSINRPPFPGGLSAKRHGPGRRQPGFTLIEIMVALLLGAFLIGGVMQIFVSTKQSSRLAEGQSRLQENARFALELLSHDIRLAGYLGCSGVRSDNPVVIANNPLVAPLTHTGIAAVVGASTITGGDDNLAGSFNSPNPALSSSPLNGVIKGTDAITVQFGESCGGFTTAAGTTVNPPAMVASNTCGINLGTGTTFATIGTPLVISDCATTHLFRASAGAAQNKDAAGLGTSSLIGKAGGYAVGSEISLFRSYTYYIQQGASGEPSLFRLDNNYPVVANSNPQEMIEGVENMQIWYGVETDTVADTVLPLGLPPLVDASANQYVTANNIPDIDVPFGTPDWHRVLSVRIVLTVRSLEDNLVSINNPARSYNGDNNFVDRRLLKTFTTTIELRNR